MRPRNLLVKISLAISSGAKAVFFYSPDTTPSSTPGKIIIFLTFLKKQIHRYLSAGSCKNLYPLSPFFVEGEKGPPLECNEGNEKLTEKEVMEFEVISVAETNETEILDQSENEIIEQNEHAAEIEPNHEEDGGKIAESDKEVVEIMTADSEEKDSGLAGGKVDVLSDKTPGGNEDVTIAESEPLTGDDDECEVTSPDIIPSSQTPSCESSFQSLRRVPIPLVSVLPSLLDSLGNKASVMKKDSEDVVAEADDKEEQRASEINTEADISERNDIDRCGSAEKTLEPDESKIAKIVSPVAGRTRRKLQQKTEGDKTPLRVKNSAKNVDEEVSAMTHKDKEHDEIILETSTVKSAEPVLAGVSREATSSPIPKFLRPFAAGGSPCRVNSLRGRNSPGVSPTTGILKRWPGNKQAVDSPSPPGKVIFVSLFCAQPSHTTLFTWRHQEDPRRRIIPAPYVFCLQFTCKELYSFLALGPSKY